MQFVTGASNGYLRVENNQLIAKEGNIKGRVVRLLSKMGLGSLAKVKEHRIKNEAVIAFLKNTDFQVKSDQKVSNRVPLLKRDIVEKTFKSFDGLKTQTNMNSLSASFATKEEVNNRYDDIKAPMSTLVKADVDGETVSLHANKVSFQGKYPSPLIAMQAPKASTLDDVWRMLDQQEVEVIVDLRTPADLKKQDNKDYVKALPTTFGNKDFEVSREGKPINSRDGNFVFRDIKIRSEEPVVSDDNGDYYYSDDVNDGSYYYSDMKALDQPIYENDENNTDNDGDYYYSDDYNNTDNKAYSSRSIQHIHYNNWLDHQGMDLSDFKVLVDEVSEKTKGKACAIHCNAGVGRTGTLMTGLMLKHLKEEKKLNMFNYQQTLENLIIQGRKERGTAFVQKESQQLLLKKYAQSLVGLSSLGV